MPSRYNNTTDCKRIDRSYRFRFASAPPFRSKFECPFSPVIRSKTVATLRLRLVARPDKPVAQLLAQLDLALPTAPRIIQNVVGQTSQPGIGQSGLGIRGYRCSFWRIRQERCDRAMVAPIGSILGNVTDKGTLAFDRTDTFSDESALRSL